jgi:hypothetical protein
VADLPFVPADPEASARLIAAFDAEGKINRALTALGSLAGADVVLLGGAPTRAAALAAAGARVVVLPISPADAPAAPSGPLPDDLVARAVNGLPAASCDAIVGLWSTFAGPSPASMAAVDRALRPDGRLVVVQDYGRDDLDDIRGRDRTAELVAWSRRGGWYLGAGFRIKVLHVFWQATSATESAALLEAAFGSAGRRAAAGLRRSRIAHNVAVYYLARSAA